MTCQNLRSRDKNKRLHDLKDGLRLVLRFNGFKDGLFKI